MAEEKAKVLHTPHDRRGMPREHVEHALPIFGRLLGIIWKRYRWHMLAVAACIFLTVYASVQGTMFTKTLIDTYITPLEQSAAPDYGPLSGAIARVAVWYGIGCLASLMQARIMVYVTQGSMKHIRDDLFAHMQELPIRVFDQNSHGDIMSVYTNDIDTLRQMISQSLPQMLSALVTVVSVLFMMLTLSVPLTLLTLAMVCLILFLSSKASKVAGKSFIAQQKNLGALNGYIEEIMSGEKVVKVFCHEQEATDRFLVLNEDLAKSAYTANMFAGFMGPISSQLGNTSYVLCAAVGCLLAINSYAGFTVGALASFLTFNRSFNMPINQITQQFNAIISALAGAGRIFSLMDEKKEDAGGNVTLARVKERPDGTLEETKERTDKWAWKTTAGDLVPLRGQVEMDHVHFSYDGRKEVLSDITLRADPGQKVALVGSTGAGKTSIMNLLERFYDIHEGTITIDGINLFDLRKQDLRRSLGMVLQDTHLFTGTVRENIRYGRLDAGDDEVEAAARLANADDFIRRLPNGYDTVLTGDGTNLSQGQRQLLAIARAAIADPPILILDEATSSIDTRTEKIVQSGMDSLMRGRTTFVIAHRLSTIRNSDQILVLEHGRIIERGSHDELLAQKGRYYELWTGKKTNA
ncbi:MAG: ABC transporter ATP-binding protein [Lachnospiraceae bacterium]